MPKDYQGYVQKMEESYKSIGSQLESKSNSSSFELNPGEDGKNVYNPSTNDSGGIKVRGTKGLMEGLRDIIGTEIEDIKVEEIDDNAVVNAKKKAKIDATRNISVDDENTDLEVDDELFD